MALEGAGKRRGLTIARRSVQGAFLVLFGLLAFSMAYPPLKLPASNIMLRLDPLAAVYSVFATRDLAVIAGFWPAWVLLGLTLISGRFFCAWICPLGTCFDAVGAVKPKRLRYYKPDGKQMREMRLESEAAGGSPRRKLAWLRPKYIFLAVVIALAFFKIDLLFVSSPLVIMNSAVTYILLPAVPVLLLCLLLVALVYRPRYWCESLCPAGALLSLTSLAGKRLPASASPLSVVKAPEACISCGACYKECDFGVSEPFTTSRAGRLRSADCTLCGDCVSACPASGALALESVGQPLVSSGRPGSRVRPRGRRSETAADGVASGTPPAPVSPFAVSRGEFIGSLGLGAVLLAGYGLGATKTKEAVLRMPGAQDEAAFLARCNRCMACVRACPTGCLKPMGLESGIQKLWTPKFVPREAGCIYDQCDQACAKVCPAGAIAKQTPDQVWIGTAAVDKKRCLGWRGKSCLVCVERCRFNAIETNGLKPSVVVEKCTGCGACEETCPTQPSSIIVLPPGVEASFPTSSGGGGGNGKRGNSK